MRAEVDNFKGKIQKSQGFLHLQQFAAAIICYGQVCYWNLPIGVLLMRCS